VALVQVLPDTPADHAGLRPGDRVVALDGRPIHSPFDLDDRLARTAAGSEVAVAYLRGDDPAHERRTLTVRTASRPPTDAPKPGPKPKPVPPGLMTDKDKDKFRVPRPRSRPTSPSGSSASNGGSASSRRRRPAATATRASPAGLEGVLGHPGKGQIAKARFRIPEPEPGTSVPCALLHKLTDAFRSRDLRAEC